MTLDFVINILRDVIERTRLTTLKDVAADYKHDQSPVTETDALVETIVAEHLRRELGEFLLVGEESSGMNLPTIGEIRRAPLLVTIDGIDGTTEFVRHVNHGDPNPLWLLAMTAVYRRDSVGRFEPLLSFAYQAHVDCLFALVDGRAVLVDQPLSHAKVHRFDLVQLPTDRPRGSLDVYLPKPECPHAIKPGLCTQEGPSGYNMASLLASCATGRALIGTQPVNFTTFHYNLWDFALWPILQAVGFSTVDFEDHDQRCLRLQPELWGQDDARPGKIVRPLVIAPPQLLPQLTGVMTRRR
jgi:hypothetical protein